LNRAKDSKSIDPMPNVNASRLDDNAIPTGIKKLSRADVRLLSKLIGDSSIKVTEEHYAQWYKAEQQRTEDVIRKSWGNEPILNSSSLEQKSTQLPN
jgi:hypothetical protein